MGGVFSSAVLCVLCPCQKMVAETKWQSPVSVGSDIYTVKLEVVAVPASHNRSYEQQRVLTSRVNGTYVCLH